jgi:hypothetical protein
MKQQEFKLYLSRISLNTRKCRFEGSVVVAKVLKERNFGYNA